MSAIALAQLGEIAELQAGVGFPVHLQGRSSGDYPVAKVGDISRVGRSGEAVISAADHYIDEGDLARLKARPIPLGSVLFAKIGEAIRQNHRVIAGCALLVDNNAMAAIPTRRVESRYLYHFLRTVDFYRLASATTVPALRKSKLERLPVPLPPLAEQKRIARILDSADALRARRREALAQLDTLLKSTFLDMFGDPVTNPMGWDVKPLKELGRVQTGATPPSKLDGMFGGEIPFVTPSDLKETWVEASRTVTSAGAAKSRTVSRGATLVSCIGAVGKMGKVGEASAFNQQINAVSWEECIADPVGLEMMRFFKAKLAHDAASTTLPILKKSRFEKLLLPLPPLDEQSRFAAIVESIEKQEASQRAHLAELDTLFASLQSRAFRGDL